MKAEVIATRKQGNTTIDSRPVKVGDIVELSEATLKNLCRKGIVKPSDNEAKAVDLSAPSILDEEQARNQANDLAAARAVKKAADDKAKAQNK